MRWSDRVSGAVKSTLRASPLAYFFAGQKSGYSRHGASKSKNSLRGWVSPAGSPDSDITSSHKTLVERSRDLWMGSPLSVSALRTIRTNVVGCGLICKPQCRDR